MFWRVAVIAGLAMTMVGCSTMRSTMLNRRDSDSYYRNGHPTKGVPITVKVPTHLDVYIYETFMLKKEGSDEFMNLREHHAPTESGEYKRNLRVVTKQIESDKVFTVDFKRPLAGSLTYNATFSGQSFSNINNMLDDDSIAQTTDLVLASAAFLGITNPVSGSQASDEESKEAEEGEEDGGAGLPNDTDEQKKITPYVDLGTAMDNRYLLGERVVAYRRFDMNAPDFEQQVQEFVDSHMNCCNHCNSSASFDAEGNRTK